jgi:hypothetical protein
MTAMTAAAAATAKKSVGLASEVMRNRLPRLKIGNNQILKFSFEIVHFYHLDLFI